MGCDSPCNSPDLRRKAAEKLSDATRFLFFDEHDVILCSSYSVVHPTEELPHLRNSFNNGRESALRNGVLIQEQRFEVHRFDPKLIYGRTMTGDPLHSEAFALCRTDAGPNGRPVYGVITFTLPQLTARLGPMLLDFCTRHLTK